MNIQEDNWNPARDRNFLNEDLTTSSKAKECLASSLKKGTPVPSGSVLQVQAVKNISVPRKNQEDFIINYDPRSHMLKFTITDGFSNGLALLTEPHDELNDMTLPGTKIRLLKPIQHISGILLFSKYNMEYVGGVVDQMAKQFQMQRMIEIGRKWGSEVTPLGGEVPPPWRPFGQPVNIMNKKELTSFKAMDAVRETQSGSKEENNPNQFEAARQEVIANVVKKTAELQLQKSFAEGKQLLNKDIVAITNEGFSEEAARATLKRFKNNRTAALKHLVDRRDGVGPERRKPTPFKPKYGDDEFETEPEPDPTHQPSNNITLFGFIKPAIPKEDPFGEWEDPSLFDQDVKGKTLNLFNLPDRYESGERGREGARQFGGRRSRGERGGGRGRSRGRHEGQHRNFSIDPPAEPKEVYERYQGMPTDFPTIGESGETNPASLRSNSNSNSVQASQSGSNVRSTYKPQGGSSFYEQYGVDRADKQSRKGYTPFEQSEKERGYRDSANDRKPISQTFDEPVSYSRTFVSSKYQRGLSSTQSPSLPQSLLNRMGYEDMPYSSRQTLEFSQRVSNPTVNLMPFSPRPLMESPRIPQGFPPSSYGSNNSRNDRGDIWNSGSGWNSSKNEAPMNSMRTDADGPYLNQDFRDSDNGSYRGQSSYLSRGKGGYSRRPY